ncbi:MAG TPA: DUF2306 domain-containing protein [bacterium]|nr:DUF2306 domain-containing protein [bacterium]
MKTAARSLVWISLWVGSLAITLSSLVYFDFDERAAFIIEKLPLPHEGLYVLFLRLHVIAAALSLPGCLILSSKAVLKRFPRFHRWCGRATGGVVILLLAPTGFYLSFFARGGWPATLGFLLSGGIVLLAMIQAIRDARMKRYASHRRFAFHVLGQLSVAVTSRALLFVLESANLNLDVAYLVSLWVPVLGTFALVEVLASPARFRFSLGGSMNKWPVPLVGSVVAALIVLKALHPPSAQAAGTPATAAQSVVQTKLLEPLQKKEANRSRFSRAAQPPQARRLRILDDAPQIDGAGRSFLAFAVDESRSFGVGEDQDVAEADWFKNAITGCVYPETGNVLVKLGEVYYASSVLLGRSAPTAPADVCRPR